MPRTTAQRYATMLLEQPVEAWLLARKAEGRSLRQIARDLYDATKREIDLTEGSIRRWLAEAEAEAAAEVEAGAETAVPVAAAGGAR